MIVVLDAPTDIASAETKRLVQSGSDGSLLIEAIDRTTWLAIRRFAELGILRFTDAAGRTLYRAPGFAADAMVAPQDQSPELTPPAEQTTDALRQAAE